MVVNKARIEYHAGDKMASRKKEFEKNNNHKNKRNLQSQFLCDN